MRANISKTAATKIRCFYVHDFETGSCYATKVTAMKFEVQLLSRRQVGYHYHGITLGIYIIPMLQLQTGIFQGYRYKIMF